MTYNKLALNHTIIQSYIEHPYGILWNFRSGDQEYKIMHRMQKNLKISEIRILILYL